MALRLTGIQCHRDDVGNPKRADAVDDRTSSRFSIVVLDQSPESLTTLDL